MSIEGMLSAALPWFALAIMLFNLGFLFTENLYSVGVSNEARKYACVFTMGAFLTLAVVNLIATIFGLDPFLSLVISEVQIFVASVFLWFSYKENNSTAVYLIIFNISLMILGILLDLYTLHYLFPG